MAATIKHCDSGLVAIRGGGDIATGVIQKFQRAGFRVAVLEIPRPTAIRRSVALSSALEQGEFSVEDLNGLAVTDLAMTDLAMTNLAQVSDF
ncbi:hypothetical protein LJC36_06515, partial [Desulfovibrio sp. OttesenSCG-928-C14]|nr:hypothetical protein [Desulfovibrio sp. OttesenSCG-928-C14]